VAALPLRACACFRALLCGRLCHLNAGALNASFRLARNRRLLRGCGWCAVTTLYDARTGQGGTAPREGGQARRRVGRASADVCLLCCRACGLLPACCAPRTPACRRFAGGRRACASHGGRAARCVTVSARCGGTRGAARAAALPRRALRYAACCRATAYVARSCRILRTVKTHIIFSSCLFRWRPPSTGSFRLCLLRLSPTRLTRRQAGACGCSLNVHVPRRKFGWFVQHP